MLKQTKFPDTVENEKIDPFCFLAVDIRQILSVAIDASIIRRIQPCKRKKVRTQKKMATLCADIFRLIDSSRYNLSMYVSILRFFLTNRLSKWNHT